MCQIEGSYKGSLKIIGIPTFKEFSGKGQGPGKRGRKTNNYKTEIL